MKRPEDMTREELEEEVAYLRHEFALEITYTETACLRRLGIRTAEAKMALALERAYPRVTSKNRLYDLISDGDKDVSLRIVDVYLCRLRKVLGLNTIETLWATGLRLTPKGLDVVRGLIAQTRAEAA